MRLNTIPLRAGFAPLLVFFALSMLTLGQSAQPAQTLPTHVKIKNFGQMDARFYRGAQPSRDDYKELEAIGIKTVIDLRDKPTNYEKPAVEALGMRYVNIPMSDKDYPQEAQIGAFLKLVNDPATGKFYVHCAGGRHRTGVMGAVYRFNFYGWDYEQVYREMKSYDFYTRWGHGEMKKYVQDYWQRSQTQHAASTPAAPRVGFPHTPPAEH